MKRIAASLLLFIYLAVSTGVVVSVHWCMDKVDSVEIGHNEAKECGKCGMHMADNNGCCKDDVKLLKMKTDQAFAKVIAPDFSLAIPPSQHHTYALPLNTFIIEEDYPLAHGPPLDKGDTYLKNRVFRI